MSLQTAAPSEPKTARKVLVVGAVDAAEQAALSLEPSGVTTVVTTSGLEALAHVTDLTPDLVIVGRGDGQGMSGGDVVRLLRARAGRRPPVVVIGQPDVIDLDAADSDAVFEEYLPADVGVSELVTHIRGRLDRPAFPAGTPSRPAVTESRLTVEIGRELQRAELAQRSGMLAVVTVAEMEQLRTRLGPKAEQALTAAFDELFALDAHILEQHSRRGAGGFYLLMPETTVLAGSERLRRLSRRVAGAVVDVDGERVHVTPVIGYSSFTAAGSADQLRSQAAMAMHDAERHLDLVPVGFSAACPPVKVEAPAQRDRMLAVVERLRAPLQIAFTMALLVLMPFLIYVIVWYSRFDLTTLTYPLVAAALAGTAAALWIESFKAVEPIEIPPQPEGSYPTASAIIAAYLPNEAATILETVTTLLDQDYPGELQVILAYNTPQHLPVEDTLIALAADNPQLLLLRVLASTSKAQNVNAALAHVRGEFVGIFDADHHPEPGSFGRAWRWLSNGHDIVQGHCVVRNGDASWVARMVAVEFETIYAVSHPGRARLHGFGIFGGSNGYWRTRSLREIRMQGSMLTEDIDSSMRSLLDGLSIVSDPGLISTELAPTKMSALWNQRMRWAQGWTQTARRHLRPALSSPQLTRRQKIGAAFLLGWTQVIPWITIQVIPILAFVAWRDGGIGRLDLLVPVFVLLSIFTFTVGPAQAIFAYVLGDPRIRSHRRWFLLYAFNSMLWYGELKNLISRVAQLKELTGERQWRVTPRTATTAVVVTDEISRNPSRNRRIG